MNLEIKTIGPKILVVAITLALGQSPAEVQTAGREGPAQKDDAVIRAAARLVEISLVAQDRRGNPVTDLTAEDFLILDKGEQEIAAFQMHSIRGALSAPLPSGIVTNRHEQKGSPSGAVSMILLDGLNTEIVDQKHARLFLLEFLEQLRPDDRVAIVTFGRRLRLLHDFTSDASALLNAIGQTRTPIGKEPLTATVGSLPEPPQEAIRAIQGLDEWIQGAQLRTNMYYQRVRALMTVAALESIAHYLARIPGRKNLIWLTAGIPIQIGYLGDRRGPDDVGGHEDFQRLVERAARALNNANVVIYPVDARGLVGPFDPALAGEQRPPQSRRDLIGPGAPIRQTPSTAQLSRSQDSMVLLAQWTGGRHFINTNDIAGAIRTAIDESRVTYTLGYYPTHGKWDGSYREIQVRVKRPGVTIRHRRGYYAFPDPPATPETIEEAMLAAAVSPLDATAIGLTAQMTPQEGAAGQRVTLTIEPEDVPLRLEENRRKATLDVWYVLLEEEGAPHSIAKYPVEVSLDEAGWRAAQATGIREERYMEFPAEARALRIVVRDRATGTLGSLRMPLPQE